MNNNTPKLNLLFSFVIFLSACTATAPITGEPGELGRLVFMETCAACHGENGEGYSNELNAPALNASEHAWHHPDQEICNWVLNGKIGIGEQMPSFGDQLSKEEVQAVIEYLHSLWEPNQLTTQQDVTARWPTPLDTGCITD